MYCHAIWSIQCARSVSVLFLYLNSILWRVHVDYVDHSFVIVSNATWEGNEYLFVIHLMFVVDISKEFSEFNATMPMIKNMTYWFGMLLLAYAIASLQDIRWENLNEKQSANSWWKRWNLLALLATFILVNFSSTIIYT